MPNNTSKSSDNKNENQLINNIEILQKLEKDLYLDLEKLPSENANFDTQKNIIYRINSTSQERVALFNQLNTIYHLLNEDISYEKEDIKDKIKIINQNEENLNRLKKNKEKNLNENIENLRLSEINTYYSKDYLAKYKILRLIGLLCLPLLVIGILRSRFIIPANLSYILCMLIFIIGLFLVVPKIIDLYRRNNMIFDEYNFPFNPNNNDNPAIDHPDYKKDFNKIKKELHLLEEGECIGPSCCSDGMLYDNKKEKCIIDEKHHKKEGFITGQSGQLYGTSLNLLNECHNDLVTIDKSGKFYTV